MIPELTSADRSSAGTSSSRASALGRAGREASEAASSYSSWQPSSAVSPIRGLSLICWASPPGWGWGWSWWYSAHGATSSKASSSGHSESRTAGRSCRDTAACSTVSTRRSLPFLQPLFIFTCSH